MAVKLRLTRVGSKKNPDYIVVAIDSKSPRDERFIEIIGHYNPQTDPSTVVIDQKKAIKWLARGAEPSNTVKKLLKISSTLKEFEKNRKKYLQEV